MSHTGQARKLVGPELMVIVKMGHTKVPSSRMGERGTGAWLGVNQDLLERVAEMLPADRTELPRCSAPFSPR